MRRHISLAFGQIRSQHLIIIVRVATDIHAGHQTTKNTLSQDQIIVKVIRCGLKGKGLGAYALN